MRPLGPAEGVDSAAFTTQAAGDVSGDGGSDGGSGGGSDGVDCLRLAGGGGLLTYCKPDGSYVLTLALQPRPATRCIGG